MTGIHFRNFQKYLLENYADCQTQEFSMEIYRAIAVELMRALNFYMFSTPDSELKDIWVCGGGGAIAPLLKTIDETLGVTVHTADELIRSETLMEDGYNYLADVTNCDAGTMGADDHLFLIRE